MTRTACSKLTSIDAFNQYKSQIDTIRGFTTEPMTIKAEGFVDHLRVTYGKHKEHSYIIPMEKIPCNYGGHRCFFKCPVCQKRMRFLYFAQNCLFLCRKCLNLTYESQSLRPTKRYEYMSKKLKKQIKEKGGNLYDKPKYMHNSRYVSLKSKQYYYASKFQEAYSKELRKKFGSRIEPFLESMFFMMLIICL